MKLTAALFAFGLTTVVASAAFAQTTTDRARVDDPALNNRESRGYTSLVDSDTAFRNRRMHTECDPIQGEDLKRQCMDSFGAAATSSGTSGSRTLTPSRGAR